MYHKADVTIPKNISKPKNILLKIIQYRLIFAVEILKFFSFRNNCLS